MTKVSQKVLWQVAEKIMLDRGWNPEESPLEWDRKSKDSQYVLIKEDLEEVLTYFESDELVCPEDGCKNKHLVIYTHLHT